MTTTGWGGEDAEAPAMPLAAHLLASRERGPGDTLAISMARGRATEARELREEAAAAVDPDERAANLIGRGVTPGMTIDLGQRLADAEAELAGERQKIAKGERVNARVRGMLERGQIGGLEASRMLDGDFGDATRAEKLERKCDRLRQQIADTAAMVAPPQERQPDGLEAASRTAHEIFREITRQRMADAQAGRTSRARRPFASVSRSSSGDGEVTCTDCANAGATPEESFTLHNDPELFPGETSRSAPHAAGERVQVPEFYGEIVRGTESAIVGVR